MSKRIESMQIDVDATIKCRKLEEDNERLREMVRVAAIAIKDRDELANENEKLRGELGEATGHRDHYKELANEYKEACKKYIEENALLVKATQGGKK